MATKCNTHKIGHVTKTCPKCDAGAPAVKGTSDQGKTPMTKIGVVRLRHYHKTTAVPLAQQPKKS